MPIYEYRCSECSRKFEQIVLRGKALDEACCPRCGSRAVERLLSPFAMSGVTRKSEESFDDDFDAPDDDFAEDLDEGGLGAGDDLGGGEEGGGGDGEPDGGEEPGAGLDDDLEDEDDF